MTAIVIAGEVIPVNVDVAEDINMEMSRADFVLNLETVGYSVERAQEKADVLIEEGYGRARAWATVDRGDLIALGIGRGFVDGLIDEMRGDFADSVGVPFQRPGMRSAIGTQPSCNCQFRQKSTFQSETRFAPLLTTSGQFAFSESHSDNFFSDALVWGVN